MLQEPQPATRFIGLDIHKHYLVAVGVDVHKTVVFGPQPVSYDQLEAWIDRSLTPQDALVLEMTTNAYDLYDTLRPHVQSVTVVHPPHVKLVTQVPVKTDRKAALALAQLHAVGLLQSIWIPESEGRDRRALIAQPAKMVRLATQARNRLQAVLHRYRLVPPKGDLFTPEGRAWWTSLSVSPLEQVRIQSDLATLTFAEEQIVALEQGIKAVAAADERVPLLLQLVGINVVGAVTILAAIDDISRFPSAAQLVGYAGLGATVHASGQTHTTGRISKAGRRDLRTALIDAARSASRFHPHWHAELARLEPRLGYSKALVAIARKLLVAVWHILTEETVDRFAQPEQGGRFLVRYAYQLGRKLRPGGQSVPAYVRAQLDRLRIGAEIETIDKGGGKLVKLPPSRLAGRNV